MLDSNAPKSNGDNEAAPPSTPSVALPLEDAPLGAAIAPAEAEERAPNPQQKEQGTQTPLNFAPPPPPPPVLIAMTTTTTATTTTMATDDFEDLALLPRGTKVLIKGNNRTKASLLGRHGRIKTAVGLGGWHLLVSFFVGVGLFVCFFLMG